MKYVLAKPISMGDLANSFVVDELELRSLSLTFDPENPVLSAVLEHKATGWQHVVTYFDSTAAEFWARTAEPQFDAIARALLEKLATDGKLPPGTLT